MNNFYLITFPRTGHTHFKVLFESMNKTTLNFSHCGLDNYKFLPEYKDNISKIMQTNKAITILRNPVDTISSFVAMDCKNKYIDYKNINEIKDRLSKRMISYIDFFSFITKNNKKLIILNFEKYIKNPIYYINNITNTNNNYELNNIDFFIKDIEKKDNNFIKTSKELTFYNNVKQECQSNKYVEYANYIYQECIFFAID